MWFLGRSSLRERINISNKMGMWETILTPIPRTKDTCLGIVDGDIPDSKS